MKIYMEEELFQYENNEKEIEKIFSEIDNIRSKKSKIVSHLIIDGYEVYENYEEYFLDKIDDIKEVEVVLITYKELVENILLSKLNYLTRAIAQIESLSNSFYKNPDSKDWNSLNNLIQGISWIMDTFVSIDKDFRLKHIISNYENWNIYAKEVLSLKDILIDFEKYLSNRDNISIADILSYEIVPLFNGMREIIELLLDREIVS